MIVMENRIFEVINIVKNDIEFDNAIKTAHWAEDRMDRHNMIMQFIGNGSLVCSFIVNTGHKNGLEIHNIFDNGVILIQNKNSKKVVTELIARPNQIRRYWDKLGMNFTMHSIINKALVHQRNGWNYW